MTELGSFSPALLEKPMIVVATKLDAAQDPERIASIERVAAERKLPFYKISSVTGQGIDVLKHAMADIVLAAPAAEDAG
jgi:GTP-binding protein